jgi:hypothetical protein
VQEYRLELEFDDGVCGTVDLVETMPKRVFTLWCDYRSFEQVQIGSSAELIRGDLVDLCSEPLYLKVTGKKPEEVFPALRQETAHA